MTDLDRVVRCVAETHYKILCQECAKGTPVEYREGGYYTGLRRGWWHGERMCDASMIRDRHPEDTAEEIAAKIQSAEPCPAEPHVHEGEGGMIHRPWDVEPKDSEGER